MSQLVGVAERVGPSVANLRVTRRMRGGHVPVGAGSGVVLTPDGFLLTSAHVVSARAAPDRRGRGGRAHGHHQNDDARPHDSAPRTTFGRGSSIFLGTGGSHEAISRGAY